MKEEIEKGLKLVNQFVALGANCQEFALRAKKLLTSYSDDKVAELTEFYWDKIEPNKHLFEQSTADELIEIVPILKEFYETNKLLKMPEDNK